MGERFSWINTRKTIEFAVILLFCALFCVLEWVNPRFSSDDFIDGKIKNCIQALLGISLAIYIVKVLKINLFSRPKNWLFVLPCLLVALNNFPFIPYLKGEVWLIRTGAWDIILFVLSTFLTAIFEEILFRGIVFSTFIGFLPKNKKGFILAFVFSSVAFGLAHFLNGFTATVLLQCAYSILTGGLFCFCFIKTKNILIPSFIHGVFNFCGTLFSKQGLGVGVAFDLETIILTTIIGVVVGVFVVYKIFAIKEEERISLYEQLGA